MVLMVTRWRISFAVVTLVLVVAVSIAAGKLGAPPGDFDWGVAATVGTAAGTTLLALFTAWLAAVSASELQTTRSLVQLQERDESRKDSAWLRLVNPLAHFPTGGGLDARCDVLVVNAGAAAAFDIIVRLEIRGSRSPGSGSSLIAICNLPVLLPGQSEVATLVQNKSGYATLAGGIDWPNLAVMAAYRDRRNGGLADAYHEDVLVFDVKPGVPETMPGPLQGRLVPTGT